MKQVYRFACSECNQFIPVHGFQCEDVSITLVGVCGKCNKIVHLDFDEMVQTAYHVRKDGGN